MTGLSPHRAYALFALSDRAYLNHTLPCPRAVQRNHLIVFIIHIDAGGQHFSEENLLTAAVHDPHASRNGIRVRKNTVGQDHLQVQNRILTGDLQRFTAFLTAKDSRHPSQRFLPVINTMRHIGKRDSRMTSRRPDRQRSLPVIPQAIAGVFHRKGIQKRTPVPVILCRHKRRFLRAQQIRQLIVQKPSAIIYMPQKVLLIHNADTVARVRRVQFKKPVFFIVCNVHPYPFPFPLCLMTFEVIIVHPISLRNSFANILEQW